MHGLKRDTVTPLPSSAAAVGENEASSLPWWLCCEGAEAADSCPALPAGAVFVSISPAVCHPARSAAAEITGERQGRRKQRYLATRRLLSGESGRVITCSWVLELATDSFAYTHVCKSKRSYQRNIAELRPSVRKL